MALLSLAGGTPPASQTPEPPESSAAFAVSPREKSTPETLHIARYASANVRQPFSCQRIDARGSLLVRLQNKHRSASTSHSGPTMPIMKARACTILDEFEQAQMELVGRAVILTDGKAGTVESVSLDELHGLRISIKGFEGKWPVSTIKFAQLD